MQHNPQLTLITPYRDRLPHLTNQLAWWERCSLQATVEWMVIEVTPQPSRQLQTLLEQHSVQYTHMPCEGPFHKTRALNLGLAQAKGELVAAFDVDLIPLGNTLARHCWLALRSPDFLVTGYRLMAQSETVNLAALTALEVAVSQASLGPEDQPTALLKHLIKGERFGVMPLFWRDRLLSIQGWDEAYIGWGAEDQDVIERYLLADRLVNHAADEPSSGTSALCRCHELTYLHLQHGPAANWNNAALLNQNRAHYYRTQAQRKNDAPDNSFKL